MRERRQFTPGVRRTFLAFLGPAGHKKKLLSMAQHPRCTIPFHLGPISEERKTELQTMSSAERAQHKLDLAMQKKCTVPDGPYPFCVRGSGWVQLWFSREDCDLQYCYHGWETGLDIQVKSKKASGTITAFGRSEVFDQETGCLSLQEDQWRKQITGKDFVCFCLTSLYLYNFGPMFVSLQISKSGALY
jgi:hypothetical protein